MAQVVENLPVTQEIWIPSLGWEAPPEEEMNGNPLQDCCLGNFHGQRSLADYSPWGHKESDGTEGVILSLFALSLKVRVHPLGVFPLGAQASQGGQSLAGARAFSGAGEDASRLHSRYFSRCRSKDPKESHLEK